MKHDELAELFKSNLHRVANRNCIKQLKINEPNYKNNVLYKSVV